MASIFVLTMLPATTAFNADADAFAKCYYSTAAGWRADFYGDAQASGSLTEAFATYKADAATSHMLPSSDTGVWPLKTYASAHSGAAFMLMPAGANVWAQASASASAPGETPASDSDSASDVCA